MQSVLHRYRIKLSIEPLSRRRYLSAHYHIITLSHYHIVTLSHYHIMQVYIRPLTLEDAKTSYKWRNNPKVWELTGSKPDKYVTEEMETEWLKNVLQRKNEKRFAVCVKDTDQYIGNIHLANIEEDQAEYAGLFLGETEFWGKGIGTSASNQMCDFAFSELHVKFLHGLVRKEHAASLAMLSKLGFKNEPFKDGLVRVTLTEPDFRKALSEQKK